MNNITSGVKMNMNKKFRILIPSVMVVTGILAIVLISFNTSQQTDAQNVSLGQLANSISEIRPNATVIKDKIDTVENVPLQIVSNSIISNSLQSNGKDPAIFLTRSGLAELTLSEAMTADGQKIISATITNIGKNKFYLKEFAMGGETESGIAALSSVALDTDYSSEAWGTNPKPSMTDLVVLNPGESFSAHIKGNWVVSEINKPIITYGAAALFYYDSDAPEYNEGRNWDLAVTNSK